MALNGNTNEKTAAPFRGRPARHIAVQGGPAAPVYITNSAADPVQEMADHWTARRDWSGAVRGDERYQRHAVRRHKALTTVAAAIAASQAIREAWVQADPANIGGHSRRQQH